LGRPVPARVEDVALDGHRRFAVRASDPAEPVRAVGVDARAAEREVEQRLAVWAEFGHVRLMPPADEIIPVWKLLHVALVDGHDRRGMDASLKGRLGGCAD